MSAAVVPELDGHRSGGPGYRRLVGALSAAALANFLAIYYVQPLLPALAEHYDVSPSASAGALSVSTITMAVALFLVGPLSDAIGRVLLIRISVVGAVVLTAAAAFAPTWHVLLLVRGLAGVLLALLPGVALAYLRDELHPSAHLRANAVYITGTIVGGSLGRLLPVPLDAAWGWTGTSLAVAAVALVCAVPALVIMPGARGFRPRPAHPRALLRDTARTLRDPALVGIAVIGLTCMGAFVGVYNAIAFRLDAAPYLLGAAATVVYLMYPIGIPAPSVARSLAGRIGRTRTLLLATAVLASGTALTAFPALPLVMVGLGVLTFGFMAAHALASGWAAERAGRAGVGTGQAAGTYLMAYYTGSAIFGAVTTRAWEVEGWTGVTVLSIGLAVVAAGAVGWAARHDRPGVEATR